MEYFLKGENNTVLEVTGRPYMDERKDLAVIVAQPDRTLPYLKMQTQTLPDVGEPVYVEGHPLGLPLFFTYGAVSSIIADDGVKYVFHTAAVSPGSSGSPVVNSACEVVAVVVGNLPGRNNNAQSLNVAVWIGELEGANAAQPQDGRPQNLPNEAPKAIITGDGEVLGPGQDTQGQPVYVPVKDTEGRQIIMPPPARNVVLRMPGMPFEMRKDGDAEEPGNGKVAIVLRLIPDNGVKIESATVAGKSVDTRTGKVRVELDARSKVHTLPVRVKVPMRDDPYSTDIQIEL